jgi:hypothetical protein
MRARPAVVAGRAADRAPAALAGAVAAEVREASDATRCPKPWAARVAQARPELQPTPEQVAAVSPPALRKRPCWAAAVRAEPARPPTRWSEPVAWARLKPDPPQRSAAVARSRPGRLPTSCWVAAGWLRAASRPTQLPAAERRARRVPVRMLPAAGSIETPRWSSSMAQPAEEAWPRSVARADRAAVGAPDRARTTAARSTLRGAREAVRATAVAATRAATTRAMRAQRPGSYARRIRRHREGSVPVPAHAATACSLEQRPVELATFPVRRSRLRAWWAVPKVAARPNARPSPRAASIAAVNREATARRPARPGRNARWIAPSRARARSRATARAAR